MTEDVTLTVGGGHWTGWTKVAVVLGAKRVAAQFEVTLSDREPDHARRLALGEGDAVTVAIDGETVISGYIDTARPSYDDKKHTLAIAGRDACMDLIDCSAPSSPGEWANRDLAQIAGDACAPFGVSVIAETDVGAPFPKVRIKEGETVVDFVRRLAAQRGVWVMGDGCGALVLARVSTIKLPGRLEKGVNIKAGDTMLSWANRYSEITVKGHAPGAGIFDSDGVVDHSAKAVDPAITRHRPLTIVSEALGDKAQLQQRAQWEVAKRAGEGHQGGLTVKGWHHPGGGLWLPNRLVQVRDDWLSIDRAVLIETVALSKDATGGTTAKLTVTPPEAWSLIPLPAAKDKTPGGLFDGG